jgi:hypothetical protein
MRIKCVKPQASLPIYSSMLSSGVEPLWQDVHYKRTNKTFRRYLRSANIKRILNILNDKL